MWNWFIDTETRGKKNILLWKWKTGRIFFFEKYSGMGIEDKVGGFVDNDTAKDGTKKIINGIEILIISYLNFVKIHDENDVVLITSRILEGNIKTNG